MEKTTENIITALKYYIPIKYWGLNDWDVIVRREEEVDVGVYRYKCSFFMLYFNKELEPVEFGRQHIIDGKVYYDTNPIENFGAGTYTLLGDVDWYNSNNWGIN